METKMNSQEKNAINAMKGLFYKDNSNNQARTEEDKKKAEERKKMIEERRIRLNDPVDFNPVQSMQPIKASWIAQQISDIMRSTFADYFTSSIMYDGTDNQIKAYAKFRYIVDDEYNKLNTPGDRKFRAVYTNFNDIEKKTTTTDPKWASILKMDAVNNTKDYSQIIVPTQELKDAIDHIVYFKNPNDHKWVNVYKDPVSGNWDSSPKTDRTLSGREVQNFYLTVRLDLGKVLYELFNGSPDSNGFEKRKNYRYDYFFKSYISTSDMILDVVRTNTVLERKMLENSLSPVNPVAPTIGYYGAPIINS